MTKSFQVLLVFILLQFLVSCASHHNDRVPSSDQTNTEDNSFQRRHRAGGSGRFNR